MVQCRMAHNTSPSSSSIARELVRNRNPWVSSRHNEADTKEEESQQRCSNKPSSGLLCPLKFENHSLHCFSIILRWNNVLLSLSSLFLIVVKIKSPLTDERIKKMWYIYTMEYYSAVKKNEIMLLAAMWMDLEIIILSEVNQKDKYHISLTCEIHNKMWHKWTYLQNRNRLTDTENREVVAKGEGLGVGKDWECRAAAAAASLQSCPTLCGPIDSSPPSSSVPGILQARTPEWVAISFSGRTSRCKLLRIGWINNKVRL